MTAVHRDLIVIGASAGGVEAVSRLVAGLPEELPAAVCVVLHLPAHGRSMLADILDREGPLPAKTAQDGERLRHGQIYVGPANVHFLVRDDHVVLSRGPPEGGHRPSIDPLFRSAAQAHRERVVGVILSGMLDDGTAGLALVEEYGGATVIQQPDDALYPAMPSAALAATKAGRVVTIDAMADVLRGLVAEPA